MPRCLVALGSNLGDRAGAIAAAFERLDAHDAISAMRRSRIYQTRPIGGPTGQRPYLNAAASFDSRLAAEELLAAILDIEAALDRRRGERWAARTIDLDLLLYGDSIIDSPGLVVPHPRMAFRRFVLAPSVEVAPEMTHAATGWSVAQLLAHLDTAVAYVSLLGVPGTGKTVLAGRLAAAFGGRFLADPAAESAGSKANQHRTGASGPAYARQIEFIAARAAVLDKRRWPADGVLAVSDFSFEQCLAYAELALAPGEFGALRTEQAAASRQVVLPKLLVVLDTPPAMRTSACGPARADIDLQASEAEWTGRLREKLLELAGRRGLGPVLYVRETDADAQFAEISAAIEAMQSRPEIS